MVRLFAQNLHAQRMERANRQPARLRLGQHFGDALLHFRGGFIGKGNRGDGMRQLADVDNQMLDFLRNHAGFAAAGAGKHEQRPAEVFDGGLLLGVEFHGERVGECVRKNYITAIEKRCKEGTKGRLKPYFKKISDDLVIADGLFFRNGKEKFFLFQYVAVCIRKRRLRCGKLDDGKA